MSSKGFTIVSNMILNDDALNIYEKYFLIALKSFDYKNKGEVYPTYEALMKLFGTTNRNTISNVVRSLKDKNYITTMKKNRANCYKFIKEYLAGNFKNNNKDNCKNSDTTSNSSHTTTSMGSDTTETNANTSSMGSDTSSSNSTHTTTSMGSDTTETNVKTSSMGSDASSSNLTHTTTSMECDTTEAKVKTSSMGSDTSTSNSTHTTSSMGCDTQIKQYKYKKEIYTQIFNRWNDKNISNEEVLTVNIAKCIECALKIFTVDQVLQTIDNYAEIYHSEFYYSYLWDLKNFLINPKGIRKFRTEGHLWKNYLDKSKKAEKIKASEYID